MVKRQSKVLVVDDDQFALRSMAKVLGGESYQVVTAASGSQAIDLLKQDTFDLVLTDLKMPEVDGLEVLRQAREIAPQAVVLILTGYASLESAIEALRKGAYDYLVKPCSDDELKLKIAKGLERVRLAEERQRAEEALKEYSERLEEMVEQRTKELQEAQEQLIRTERLAAIGQLAASVGHELRNPLGIINNSVYYLNMKLRDADEKMKKHLKIMEREILSSNKIINDLLGFTRERKPTLKEADINVIVEDALSRTAVPNKVAVITKLGENLPPLMADPNQIQQVFINLISNAAQAMTSSGSVETSNGGRLEIATKVEGGFIVTEFKDNGCGIPEENLGRLFEPLFTTKAKGIGLGLAVSRSLVEGHGGTIEVESPSAGLGAGEVERGTTFRVRLPIRRLPGRRRGW
jgi:two-component system NtrC family sensor kinase